MFLTCRRSILIRFLQKILVPGNIDRCLLFMMCTAKDLPVFVLWQVTKRKCPHWLYKMIVGLVPEHCLYNLII